MVIYYRRVMNTKYYITKEDLKMTTKRINTKGTTVEVHIPEVEGTEKEPCTPNDPITGDAQEHSFKYRVLGFEDNGKPGHRYSLTGPYARLGMYCGSESDILQPYYDKADQIVKALIDNELFIGDTMIDCFILSKEGQFVLFSSIDPGVGNSFISLKAFLPYMDKNGDLQVINYGNVSIQSQKSVSETIRNNSLSYGYGPIQAEPYNKHTGYIQNSYMPNMRLRENISLGHYAEELWNGQLGSKDTMYSPIFLWAITLDQDNEAPVHRLYPDKVAINILKGKAKPLIFAGTVDEE